MLSLERPPRLPESLRTARLVLAVPTAADAAEVRRAVNDSFDALHRWLPWAGAPQSLAEARDFCSSARQQWRADEAWALLLRRRDGQRLIGASGFPRIDWSVPAFEIGYWCHSAHTGRGYVTEAVTALTDLAFERYDAARVELRIDERNVASIRVAERAGFEREGVLRAVSRDSRGALRNLAVYARLTPPGAR